MGKQKDIDAREQNIRKVEDERNAIEDQVFSQFCHGIRVQNIR